MVGGSGEAFKSAAHLRVSGRVIENKEGFGNFILHLNCVTVVQLGEVLSPASDSHLGLQPNIFVMLLLTQT